MRPLRVCRLGLHPPDLRSPGLFANSACGRIFALTAKGDCGFEECLAARDPAAWATGQLLEKISTFPPLPLYPILFLAKFDTRQIRQRLPAPWQALQGAPAQAGAAEFKGHRECPKRPCPSLALSGKRTDQSATGRLLRRSSGTRFSRVVRAIRGDRLRNPKRGDVSIKHHPVSGPPLWTGAARFSRAAGYLICMPLAKIPPSSLNSMVEDRLSSTPSSALANMPSIIRAPIACSSGT